jgi:heme-degrading monooxygenase HmoA
MILRKWSGRIRTEDREAYLAYVLETGADDYARTPGNIGFHVLTRDCGDGTCEIATMSWWDSTESIRGFAGDDIERARYYPEDDRYLVERPENVEHYRIEAGRVNVEVDAG